MAPSSHFHVTLPAPSEEPQILIANELNIHKAFSPSNLANMKRLLEGEGMPVEYKFGNLEYKYVGIITVITSNTLPFNGMDPDDKKAIEARCCIVKPEVPS